MFNIGPLELVVLALVGLVVLGPDKLPGLARDAAQMLKTLRELATGARQQLRDELGPEFADVDLRNLNPRTAVTKAVFGDDFDPRSSLRDALLGSDSDSSLRDDLRAADPRSWLRDDPADGAPVSFDKSSGSEAVKPVTRPVRPNGHPVNGVDVVKGANGATPAAERPRPRPRPTPRSDYDDAT